MKLYVVGGKAKSGKNTFGKFLKEELKKNGYKPCILHITDPLYRYAKNHFEWDETYEKPREFLQKMGIDLIQEKLGKKTFLLDRLQEDIEILSEFFDAFIIVDARLKKEFEILKEKYDDVKTFRVKRITVFDDLTEDLKNHITETDLDDYNDFDYEILNVSINKLQEKAKEIIENEEVI